MSEPIKKGGAAFPFGTCYPGMTLRDYFAAKAMQSLVALDHAGNSHIAIWSYEIADAMLAESERK